MIPYNIDWINDTLAEKEPDYVIQRKDAKLPYLERWFVRPRTKEGPNIYLHKQYTSDQDPHLHDHPWENTSIILAGGYFEELGDGKIIYRPPGSIIHRKAEELHRLHLYDGMKPSTSLFITGRVRRKWGFQVGSTWEDWESYLERVDPEALKRYRLQKITEEL